MKIKIGDIVIVLVVIIGAILLFCLNFPNGNTVVVEIDGEVLTEFSVEENTEYIYKGDYTNVIRIKDGAVSIIQSDCPDNTCVHTGEIKSSAKVICCLPNKLVVRIAKNDKSETDVISG
jgi:hypothetical protein